MPKQVIMPRLDKDMEDGRIASWHRAKGDKISKGDVLFEIETDKAAVEVAAEADGVLHHISLGDGETAAVGSVVAWLYGADETVGPPPETTPNDSTEAPQDNEPAMTTGPTLRAAAVEPDTSLTDVTTCPSEDRLLATPAARAQASAKGVSLSGVTGTGPSGRIQKSDIIAAAAPASAAASVSEHSAEPPGHFNDQTGPLSVLSSGGGEGVALVMIHGFLADAAGWDKLAKPLGRRRPVHLVELPCHGRSPMRRVSDFADLVREIRHVFDSLKLERCHLVGHSLGGALALAVADTRPRTVASLTLISPAGLGPKIDGTVIDGMCRATRAESLGPWMKLLTSDPDAIGWTYVQAAAAGRRDSVLRASQRALADVLFPDGVQAFDLRPALDRLTPPTRIIWGRDDRIIPWKHALHAPGHISLNLFRGVGHMPHYEVPELLIPFLDELP
ncbi:acetoin dehydrogenase dihydrolipoyllysine-residue acetyltransferase subunit [Roseovarius sp.]|uniref:acetoin dehydrogenase dihydrolipoyllysine-residue acetyltransferase subunit n=1 Tax=Roseovarius sp. TaxID=1486281 RepID=UPI003567825B